MSKEFRLEVGAQGLSTLIEVLATDTSNSDIPLKLNQGVGTSSQKIISQTVFPESFWDKFISVIFDRKFFSMPEICDRQISGNTENILGNCIIDTFSQNVFCVPRKFSQNVFYVKLA